MNKKLEQINHSNKDRVLYNFYDAKEIYLARTPSKYFLLEKKEKKNKKLALNLLSRNIVVINKNGMLLFPENR